MSAASEPNWTPSQKAALEHFDGALLVSAAAGSGKTAVLAARCAYLICDAPQPCDVDQLLVLTFTRAAAAEMKDRIDATIRRRAEQSSDERILRQLRLIDRAAITTIDAFCGQLVREHFHLVGVDPGFAILAPEDASLIRNDIAGDLVEAEFDANDADTYRTLIDGYFGGDAERLRRALVSAHTLSQSIVDPARWIEQSLQRLRDAAAGEPQSELLRAFTRIRERAIASTRLKLTQASARAKDFGIAGYVKHADELIVELDEWAAMAEAGDLDKLAKRVCEWNPPRLPPAPSDTPGKDGAQGELNAGKDRMKKGGDVHGLCRWTSAQLREDAGRLVPLVARFFDLLTRFTRTYDRTKAGLRSLDFADVEALALRILRAEDDRPSATAHALQQRYRHVLVDEFQDINPLQYALLRLVSRDRAAELDRSIRSNLFSVGDVKQSIYRFRLAEPQQFIDRGEALSQPEQTLGTVIHLQENFRSRAPLLEAVNEVFARLMTRESAGIVYDDSHELRAFKEYEPVEPPFFTGKPIELHLLSRELPASDDDDASDDVNEVDSFEREIAFMARRIREIVEVEKPNITVRSGGKTTVRPARYGDIVVLLRSARFKSSQVADALRLRGMPVHSDNATGFFNAVEVQDVLSVLRVLSNARQDVPLAAVLRSPLFALPAKEDALAAIRVAYPDEQFHRAVVRYGSEQSDDLAGNLRHVRQQLADWRTMFRERPVGEALRELIEHNGFDMYCRARDDGAQRLANLKALLARAEAFDAFERQGLDRFLAFLNDLEANDELGRPSLGAESEDVVRVMTIHKSKGLEFPIVVIPDLGKKFNTMSLAEPILLDRDLGVGMMSVDLRKRIRYPNVSSIVVRDHARRQAVAEEIRVLYVALTRAREHVVLVGSVKGHDVVETWRSDWSQHAGALPDEIVLDAQTPLDWLGPIAAMTDHAGLGTFKIVDHTQEKPEATPDDPKRSEIAPPTAEARVEHESIKLTDPVAMLAIERINFAYPFEVATKQRLTMPVTEFVAAALPQVEPPRGSDRLMEWPAAYRPRARASAVEVGTATHALLQMLDCRAAADADAIRSQIGRLIERKLLTPDAGKLVDVDAIVWLLGTELGELMKSKQCTLRREQPLAIALPALGRDERSELDPSAGDRILVRGRVDLLIESSDGLALVDYKSDRIEPEDVPERAARYAPQLWGYADAVRHVTGRPVVRASLAFLRPRRIADVPVDR